jgi:hypothetical protein
LTIRALPVEKLRLLLQQPGDGCIQIAALNVRQTSTTLANCLPLDDKHGYGCSSLVMEDFLL